MSKMKILFVCEEIKHYTIPFFRRLHEQLSNDGIEMRIVYGASSSSESTKLDSIELAASDASWVKRVRSFRFLRGKVLYQAALIRAIRSDLVIVDQGSRHVINYILLLASKFGWTRVAYWGHGRNLQSSKRNFSEALKRKLIGSSDRWFAYTESTRKYLLEQGVAERKITVIQNSIDTETFRRELDEVSPEEISLARRELGISASAKVGIYCGSLYAEKELDILFLAARAIRSVVPDFHLLVVGAGPDQVTARASVKGEEWIHFRGVRFGKAKALDFRLSQGFLHPGAVGLAALDSLVAGIPILTLATSRHGPEFEYLADGRTAAIFPDADSFVKGAVALFTQPDQLRELGRTAIAESKNFGIEPMVRRYRDGILATLGVPANGNR